MPQFHAIKGQAIEDSEVNMLGMIQRLWGHMSHRRHRQIGLLFILMIISAFAEVVSVGAIVPFLGVLIAPEQVFSHPIVAEFSQIMGIKSANELVLPLTISFAVAALLAGGVRILLLWFNTHLAAVMTADLSLEIYRRTLYQPYQVHVARNSSVVISNVTSKVHYAGMALQQGLLFISSMLILVAILLTLFVINTMVALISIVSFSILYGLISWLSRKHLNDNAQYLSYGSTQAVKALQEGLGAIRDVLLDGSQPFYCEIYHRSDYPLRLALGNNVFIGGSPRYIIEASIIGLMAILAYSLNSGSGGVASALPVLGALALGAQRMLPALQQMYIAWSSIAGTHASIADTLELLDQPLPVEALKSAPTPLAFRDTICFDSVYFRYGSDSPWVLRDFSLNISKGSRIGLVGSTGSGKSTVLDLLMGLTEPTEGTILIDGHPLTSSDRRRAWQQIIAHVPQSIYLADGTLVENIAFGVLPDEVDMSRVRQVARQAQIAEFIESRAGGYNAFVGERGICLSGGQRQRIGIARALYKKAEVLIFDEATSALDNRTEKNLMKTVEGLNRNLTIVMVAHRLSTVKRCETIVELEQGQIIAQGSYDQLLGCSQSFREMAQVQREGM